jgi:hypothetical protein
MMTAQISYRCAQHVEPFVCPDVLITYEQRFDEYGIIIHDGGSSAIMIAYCPWCGTALPDSKRDRWFETLEALGFDDPGVQSIPISFATDAWYRQPAPEDTAQGEGPVPSTS